jgi:hypothetical protein
MSLTAAFALKHRHASARIIKDRIAETDHLDQRIEGPEKTIIK